MFVFLKHLRPTHHSFGPSTGIDRDPAGPVDNRLTFGPLERKLINTRWLANYSGPAFEALFSPQRAGGPAFMIDRGAPGELQAAIDSYEATEAAKATEGERQAQRSKSFAERLARGEL